MLTDEEKQIVRSLIETSKSPRMAVKIVKAQSYMRRAIENGLRPRKLTKRNVLGIRRCMSEKGVEWTPKQAKDYIARVNRVVESMLDE